MKNGKVTQQKAFLKDSVACLLFVFLLAGSVCRSEAMAYARGHTRTHKSSAKSSSSTSSTRHGSSNLIGHVHHGRYHGRGRLAGRHRHVVAHAVRHAYPENFFLWKAPQYDPTPLTYELSQKIRYQFAAGCADDDPASTLIKAGAVASHPLRGGIFFRREPIKYIVLHSTETGRPMDAEGVINSWGSAGRRHAGAHYVVDRDGQIYQAVDPELAAVHVNIFKTLPGINNDNSIGIEMVHTGAQTYTREQRASVVRLVTFLQDHFHVADQDVITHRYAQQGDHTDPVGFDWDAFLATKAQFRKQAMANKMTAMAEQAKTWWTSDQSFGTVFLQVNGRLPVPGESKSASKPNGKPVKASLPSLRGPIEMDPQTAGAFNELMENNQIQSQPEGHASAQATPDSTKAHTP